METIVLRVAVDVAVTRNTSKAAGEHLLDAMYDIARRVCERENLSLRCARLASLGVRPDLPFDEDFGLSADGQWRAEGPERLM